MRSDHQKRIDEFMRLANQDLPAKPTVPTSSVAVLRAAIMFEELLETIEQGLGCDVLVRVGDQVLTLPLASISFASMRPPDLEQIADGVADISVTAIGTASACGIAMEPILEEVDASNLRKFELPKCPRCDREMIHESDGAYTCQDHTTEGAVGPYKRADGKWVKAPDFVGPDIDRCLREQQDGGGLQA